MLCMGVLGGCGNSAGEASDKNASKSEKELTGKIDEIKDFQFVITDDKDTPYSFTFDGEVISVEKVK